MKIAAPWPIRPERQPRIKESLSLWSEKPHICLAEPCDDPFFDGFTTSVMPRNSKDIGGIGKCYIRDMLDSTMQFNQDWYGFCNSDCVPDADLIDERYEVLIFHRTDIQDWAFRDRRCVERLFSNEVQLQIWNLRSEGKDDKFIARRLNVQGTPPPDGREWTHILIQQLCAEQGGIFIMGQDMYLFRKDVLPKIAQYMNDKDPIIGTAGFDPRLTHWCIKNCKTARIVNKLYHKIHESEWKFEEVECQHNGGNITEKEQLDYCDGEFINLCRSKESAAIPSWFINLIQVHRPELYRQLISSSKI